VVRAHCEPYTSSQRPVPDLAFDTVESRMSTASREASKENKQLFTTVLRIQLTASSVQISLPSVSLPEAWVVLSDVLASVSVSTDLLHELYVPDPPPLYAWTTVRLAEILKEICLHI
jgi:hypothetical protein